MSRGRHLTRFVAWLKSIILGSRDAVTAPKLFATLSEQRMDNGILRRVTVAPEERPDLVIAFLFIPYRKRGQHEPQDWLLCCDIIEGSRSQFSHYVTVASLPHFAKDLSLLQIWYAEPWDLQGRAAYPNLFVLCIITKVANSFRWDTPQDIDWGGAIERARDECWGGTIVPAPEKLGPRAVFAQPYDPETKKTRIILRSLTLWGLWLFYE